MIASFFISKSIMRFSLLFSVLFISMYGFSQGNNIYGGSSNDFTNKAIYDSNGYLYTIGYTRSSDFIIDTTYGANDAWIQKLDSNRNIIWSKAYGGSEDDAFNDIVIINNKLYCAGTTASDSGDIVFNHGANDFWLAVIDTSGNLLFDSCYGGQDDQFAYSILQYTNSNLIISGTSNDTTGQISVHFGARDFWFIEVDTLGNLIREKSIGGPSNDFLNSSALLPNGDILFAGSTINPAGAFSNYHGGQDGAVACLDTNWNSKWKICFGESNYDAINDIYIKSIDTVLFVGYSYSNTAISHGVRDAVIWQTNRVGIESDIKLFGGGNNDDANSIIQDTDSTYLLIGDSQSHTGQLYQNYGMEDVFIFQVDFSLNLLQANNYGGTKIDKGVCILKKNDSTSVIIANTKSDDIQVPINYGQYDLWILDTVFSNNSTSIKSIENSKNSILVFPNPASTKIYITSRNEIIKSISIYGIQGSLLESYRTNSKEVSINVRTFSSGVYLLQILYERGSPLFRKILIK
jgi:hypothetical protein